MVERQMGVLGMLAEGHHHRQFTLTHDVVGLTDITHVAYKQPDMLHAHATRSVTISDVMAGVMVEFGAEETGSSLARTSAIPAETHDIKQEVFQFRSVVRGDQHHMTRTPFVGKETTVRAARLERARQPFLPVKQFVLIPHRVTKTH
ncbi:hypothetical protein D3C86_1399570 [compost metagenome]